LQFRWFSAIKQEDTDDMVRGRPLPTEVAMMRLGWLIACCQQCSVEWDIGLQPSRCCDTTHEWTLRVA
jgi:hypothetical protein